MNKIIGVDCATEGKRVGLALAELSGDCPRILELTTGTTRGPAEWIAEWIEPDDVVLLALDAPLGWPMALGDGLASHRAGEPLSSQANELFRRSTDRDVHERIGRRPLEVGADRIARTAVAALGFLDELRGRLGEPVPLAWSIRDLPRVSAIEVYPAGTLTAYGQVASGYKKTDQVEARRRLIRFLGKHLELPDDTSALECQADVLDAVVCVLAGLDFLGGRATAPADVGLAAKEGWIWVREPTGR